MQGMRFEAIIGKESYVIDVDQVNGFGKNPSLWIKSPPDGNTFLKVASFANEKKAEMFVKYLTKFLGQDP